MAFADGMLTMFRRHMGRGYFNTPRAMAVDYYFRFIYAKCRSPPLRARTPPLAFLEHTAMPPRICHIALYRLSRRKATSLALASFSGSQRYSGQVTGLCLKMISVGIILLFGCFRELILGIDDAAGISTFPISRLFLGIDAAMMPPKFTKFTTPRRHFRRCHIIYAALRRRQATGFDAEFRHIELFLGLSLPAVYSRAIWAVMPLWAFRWRFFCAPVSLARHSHRRARAHQPVSGSP